MPEETFEWGIDDWTEYWDNVSGQPLDPAAVRAARIEEVEYIRGRKLYDTVPITECWERTGKKQIAGMWVDVNKGLAGNLEITCRLVARYFKSKHE